MPINTNIPQCTHLRLCGRRCGSPAITGEHFCYWHLKVKAATKAHIDSAITTILLLEDADSVQAALMQVIDMLLKDQVTLPKARIILRAIEIASHNVKELSAVRIDAELEKTRLEEEKRQQEEEAERQRIEELHRLREEADETRERENRVCAERRKKEQEEEEQEKERARQEEALMYEDLRRKARELSEANQARFLNQPVKDIHGVAEDYPPARVGRTLLPV